MFEKSNEEQYLDVLFSTEKYSSVVTIPNHSSSSMAFLTRS